MRVAPLLILAVACQFLHAQDQFLHAQDQLLHAQDQFLHAQDELYPVFHFKRLTVAEGLPSKEIRTPVIRDRTGYIWVGTATGLARYDGYGCKVYRNDPNDPTSLSSNTVMGLLEDSRGRLWVGTWESGLSLYVPEHDRFVNFRPRPGDSTWLQARSIQDIFEDRSGNIWLSAYGGPGGPSGIVHVRTPHATGPIGIGAPDTVFRFTTYPVRTPRNVVKALGAWEGNRILVCTDRGLHVLDPDAGRCTTLRLPFQPRGILDTLRTTCLARDRRGNLWVGTVNAGLFKIDPGAESVVQFRHRDGDPASISNDHVMQIAEDLNGNLWVATRERIDRFSDDTGRRLPYLTFGNAPVGSEDQRLSVDREGTVWISTGTGGVYWLSRKSARLPNFSLQGADGSPLYFSTMDRSRDGTLWCASGGRLYQLDKSVRNVVSSIEVWVGEAPKHVLDYIDASVMDDHGNLWCGTWGMGLFRVSLATGKVHRFGYDNALMGYSVARSLARGSGDTLWCATYYDGFMQFDPASGSFLRHPGLRTESAWYVMLDRRGRVWAGDDRSDLRMLDPQSGTVSRFVHDPSNPRSLSHDRARVVFQDPSGRIWVGAGNVINLWDSASGSFTRYSNPLFDKSLTAVPLGSDIRGRLWVSYLDFGLGILDPATGSFTNFDASDGLCGNVREMENLSDGTVVLSGRSGLNIVNPDSIAVTRAPPPLAVSRLSINDNEVFLPPPHTGTARLDLTHAQNVIEFEFAALDIDAPSLVRYEYMLEGLESGWVRTETRRFVRYTALPPGEYTFRVRATSMRGEWPPLETAIAVSIAPPWWQSAWAYGIYILLIAGVLFGAYRLRLRDLRLRQRAEIEHLQAEHLADVDRLKSRFFANISHEFRTPLTLILGPIRKWQEQASDEAQRKDLAMAERNAHRLMRLINQLLDLSKLDAGAMKLNAKPLNIVPLVKGIANSFESSAGLRGIALTVRADQEVIEVHCDRDMIEKILTNLLSNAFKFTPAGGSVSVSVRALLPNPDQGTRTDSSQGSKDGSLFPPGAVEVIVSDTGIGIPSEELGRVFDRFYQVDASQTREHEGSGIGLALVQELVNLHHGAISVRSEVGKGTTFAVRLPLGHDHLNENEIAAGGEADGATSITEYPLANLSSQATPPAVAEDGTKKAQPSPGDGRRPTILLIEDNADVRGYIKGYLDSEYTVLEACDGQEGVERALETVPDLVISDVMMPKKDGYEVCRALKLDERTNHVPLILLTAKAGVENKIEGLEIGADDYVVKPFEPKELLARARNLITLRRSLRDKFTTAVPLRPGEVAVPSMGESFLEKVRASVERHIGEERFNVEDLSRDVGLSRSQVLRKLTELTGMSARDFIRYIRLHRAMDLLKQDAGTVSEIAYIVGFSSPAHFTKCFHELFGTVPSAVRMGNS